MAKLIEVTVEFSRPIQISDFQFPKISMTSKYVLEETDDPATIETQLLANTRYLVEGEALRLLDDVKNQQDEVMNHALSQHLQSLQKKR